MIKYLKNQYKLLKKSIKELDSKTTLIVLYDLIFFLIFGLSLIIFSNVIKNKSIIVNALNIENLMDLPRSEIDMTYSSLKSFITTLIVGIIIISIITFISMAIIKSIIWFTTIDKKFKKEDILKFIPVRFVWLLIELGLTVILFLPLGISIGFASSIKSTALVIFFSLITLSLFIILMTLKNFMYIFYIESKNIRCIKKAFKFGLKKIHYYILPYTIIFILFIIISQLYWIYQFFPEKIVNLVNLLIFTIFAVWTRFYILKITKDLA
jgi:hypothetical protein